MYQTGYGRFRPNKSDYHLGRRYYRGGWHRPYPPLIPRPLKSQEKHRSYPMHLEFPGHDCSHCQVFAPAAPRRARPRVSVAFWGLPLSGPLPVIGLVGRYPTNYLMGRGPIPGRPLGRARGGPLEPSLSGRARYGVLAPLSGGYPPPGGRLPTRYSPVCRLHRPKGRCPLTCMC